jgi:hypothetical protein
LDLSNGIKRVVLIDIKNQTEAAFQKDGEVWELVGYNLITSGRNDNKHAYDTPKGYFIVQNTLTFIMFSYKEDVLLEDAIEREDKKVIEFAEAEDKRIENIKKHREMAQQANIMMFDEGNGRREAPIENDEEALVKKTYEPQYTEEDYEEVTKYSRANYGIRFSGGGYLHGIPLKDETVARLEEEGGDEAVKKRKTASERNLGTFKASHKCVRNVEEFQSFLYYDFIGYDEKYGNKRWKRPKNDVAVIVF